MKKSSKTRPNKNKKSRRDKRKIPTVQTIAMPENRKGNVELVEYLKLALEHQQADRLIEAEKSYQKVLEIDPGNAIALQLLGSIVFDQGNYVQAADYFGKALESSPGNAEIHNNLGNTLNQLEKFEEATRHFEMAVNLDPEYALAYNNLGASLIAVGRLEEAREYIEKSLALRPDNAQAHNNLGNALKDMEKYDQAVEQYNKALKLQPDFPDAYYNLGIAFEHAEMFQDAVNAYKIALELNPQFGKAHYNLGNVYKNMNSLEDAEKQYGRALEIDPAFSDARNNLGVVLNEMGKTEEAEKSWKLGMDFDNSSGESGVNLGKSFRDVGRFEEAIANYRQAIAINPDFAEAYNNLGIVLGEDGQLEESIQSFRSAIERAPDFADAHLNLALVLFMAGDLENGWNEYEWRWKADEFNSPKRYFQHPQWDGSSLEGKSILLWGEQGLGDETRYASLIPEMLGKGADVSIECTPRLTELFKRSFPSARVYDYPYIAAETGKVEFDFQCPLPGLGRYLRPTVETFSSQPDAYLVADPDRVLFWRDRLSSIGPRPKIGINWRSMHVGNKWAHYYADSTELAPIMTIEGVDFVNLMYDSTDEELTEFEALYGVTLWDWADIDMKNNIDDVAALNTNLDMVVSCLSSVSEMSGALGIPTLGFIGDRNDAVMMGTGNAVWYPNTTYYAKNRRESWLSVFEKIASEIRLKFSL